MEEKRFHQRVTRWRLQATSDPPISQTQDDDVLDGDDEDALVHEWLGDDDA